MKVSRRRRRSARRGSCRQRDNDRASLPLANHLRTLIHRPPFQVPATLNPTDTAVERIAMQLHSSVARSRQASFVEDYMSVASHLMRSAVDRGHTWFFAAPPGQASVNSNTTYVHLSIQICKFQTNDESPRLAPL